MARKPKSKTAGAPSSDGAPAARTAKSKTKPQFGRKPLLGESTLDEHVQYVLEGARYEFEQGHHEALETALRTVTHYRAVMPEWLGQALLKLVKSSETQRQRRARDRRHKDRFRAITVIVTHLNGDMSLEDAYAKVADSLAGSEYAGGADTMKRATDWFLETPGPIGAEFLARLRDLEAQARSNRRPRSKRIIG